MSSATTVHEQIQAIETYLMSKPGTRGMDSLFPAVRGELSAGVGVLSQAKRVLILTGFYVSKAGACETDGPLGVAPVAEALHALGAEVTVAASSHNFPVVDAAIKAMLALCPGAAVETVEITDSLIDTACRGKFDAVLSVETPGQANDGTARSMRGQDITEWHTPPPDPIFRAKGVTTVSVGDGGNELGFGQLLGMATSYIENGATIACATPSDTLILGAVSNWACYAIAMGLHAIHTRRLNAKKGPDVPASLAVKGQVAVLAAMLGAGAVDGVTGEAVESIDGMPWEEHAAFIEGLPGFEPEKPKKKA
ncbi:protein of unknown function (DUF4392) [Carpediemonas membranifera]|uniref:D-glutamate cyclase-like C-terminal domain-containing protein n=1 Tax=Carpediemonas membranifera TaxID=201153 RepID=A0A8J6E0A8_9EUKA|nr:protein of unknown function (DUF4392) [Carpediemonas membranifera]|eukprot:KAG9394839.1 protein of unknown function (DUF4392) [Carpediemonas membranifera]